MASRFHLIIFDQNFVRARVNLHFRINQQRSRCKSVHHPRSLPANARAKRRARGLRLVQTCAQGDDRAAAHARFAQSHAARDPPHDLTACPNADTRHLNGQSSGCPVAPAVPPWPPGQQVASKVVVKGDIGVDPGPIDPSGPFWDDQEGRLQLQCAVEIKHGRISMMAFLGMMVQELGITFPGSINLDGSVQFSDILKDGMGFRRSPTSRRSVSSRSSRFAGFAEIGAMPAAQSTRAARRTSRAATTARSAPSRGGYPLTTQIEDVTARNRALTRELPGGRAAMLGTFGAMCHSRRMRPPTSSTPDPPRPAVPASTLPTVSSPAVLAQSARPAVIPIGSFSLFLCLMACRTSTSAKSPRPSRRQQSSCEKQQWRAGRRTRHARLIAAPRRVRRQKWQPQRRLAIRSQRAWPSRFRGRAAGPPGPTLRKTGPRARA